MTESVSKLQVVERQVDDVTVLILSGEMVVDDGDLVFWRQIRDLVAKKQVKIVVDLGGVTYIDSAGLGMMVGKLKTVQDAGGVMKLVNLTNRNQRLLALFKLATVFEIFEDEASAVRSFSWSAKP